jgi:hypothetical protein
MADDGPELRIREWLTGRRVDLNGRFRAMARARPGLDPGKVLGLCRELLPPLAVKPHPGLPELLDAVFDLILLHSGRGLIGIGSTEPTALEILLRQSFPALLPRLLERPRSLPAALSNATENMAATGARFAKELALLAGVAEDAGQLEDAGGILAWRLGEPRLRRGALERASGLPGKLVLAALGEPGWPEPAAPVVVAALGADAWRRLGELFTPVTLEMLSGSPGVDVVDGLVRAAGAGAPPCDNWPLRGSVGDFTGFDGDFEFPPILLETGPESNRHCFMTRHGPAEMLVHADAFGWSCQPVVAPQRNAACFGIPTGTTSAIDGKDYRAHTRANSFRIRVHVPPRMPL